MAITNIYKGDVERSDIQKIYKGTTLLYEKVLPQGETWVLNEYIERLSGGTTFNINFTSNDIDFNSINFVFTQAGPHPITVLDYDNTNVWFAGWVFTQAYRTITFETAPMGALLTWLETNAVKQ